MLYFDEEIPIIEAPPSRYDSKGSHPFTNPYDGSNGYHSITIEGNKWYNTLFINFMKGTAIISLLLLLMTSALFIFTDTIPPITALIIILISIFVLISSLIIITIFLNKNRTQ